MADITASTTLDNSQFSRGLQDALKQARTFRTNVTRTLNFNPLERLEKSAAQVNTTFARIRKAKIQVDTSQAERGLAKLGTAATTVRRQTGQTVVGMRQLDAAVKANANQIRNLEAAYNRGEVETGSFIRQMSTLRGVAQGLSTNLDQDSSALVRLNANLKRADAALASANDKTNTVAQAVIHYRNATLALRNEVESSVVSQEEAIATARRLRDESLAAAQGTERWSTEYRELLVASGRADRTIATLEGRVTKLGLSQNVAIGSTNRLADSFQRLQGALTGALAAFGLGRGLQTLTRFSGEAATARNTLALFYRELEKAGVSVDVGTNALQALASEFQTTEDAVAEGVTRLLRYGATLDQAVLIIQRGAASALAAGKTTAAGIEAVTQALVGEISQALNRIGIAANLSTAYQQYARDVGKATDELTAQEKVQATILNVLPETESEYEALGQTLAGFVGSQNRATTAWTNFRRALGRGAETFLAPLLNTLTRVLNLFTSMPAVLQVAITSTGLLAASVTALAIAYGAVQAALRQAQPMQTLVTGLVERELATRTALGSSILRLAGRYGLLTREQARSTAVARRQAGKVTVLGTAFHGLRAGLNAAITGMRRLTVASLRFLATPVGLALAAIGGAVALITTAVKRNRAIVEPALEAVQAAVGFLTEQLGFLGRAIRSVFEDGSLLSNFFRGVLARVASNVARQMLALAESIEIMAARFKLLREIGDVGIRQAWENFGASVDATRRRFERLRSELDDATQAAIDGTAATSAWGDAAEDAGEDAAAAAEEVEKLRKQFEERLRGIEISLIEDDQAREVAEVRREFETLREEIREAGRENEGLNIWPFLSRSYELERQKLAQIQEQYDREQAEEARQQTEELQDALQERQRALEDAQLAGRANEAQLLQVEYERRMEDTRALYDDLIGMAREYGRDTSELEETRTQELLAIQEAHAREVRDLWSELQSDINEFQADVTRQGLEGDERALLSFDYASDLQDLEERLTEFRERAAGNAQLLSQVEQAELDARQQLHEDYWDNVMTLTRERGQELVDLERDLRLNAARLADDAEGAARIENEARLAQIRREYDQRAAAAGGNAQELRRIEALRAEAIRQSNEQLAQDIRDIEEEAAKARIETQEEAAAAIVKGEQELRRRRAELRDDQVELVQLEWAEERQAIQDRYEDLLEQEGLGASQYAALLQQRNDQVAALDDEFSQKLQDARDEAAAQTFEPTLDRLTEGLDDASLGVLGTIREQLEGWRAAYGNNGEVVDLIDEALEKVTGRIGKLRDEAAKHIESLLSDAQEATSKIFRDDFRDDLSEVETLLADAAERARELRARQSSLLAALPTATEEQRRAILAEVQTLDQAIDLITSSSVKAAEQATREALDAYTEGLEEARREASDAAIDLAAEDIESIIDGISNVQILALDEARTNLARLRADFAAEGLDTEALQPLNELEAQLDAALAHQARSLADFAADSLQHLRSVADAVLDEAEAREVAVQSYRRLIDRRRAALAEAQREGASLDELTERTRGVTNAQIELIGAYQQQIRHLQDVRGAYIGTFSAARDLAGLLGEAVPPEVLDAQRELAESSLDSVRALQEEGASFREYKDELQEATGLWGEYQDAQRAALGQEFDNLAQGQERGLFDAGAFTDLARDLAESFAISYSEARNLLSTRLRKAAEGEDVDLFAGLEARAPEVLRDILEDLNQEAVEAPGAIEDLNVTIADLEGKVEELQRIILGGFDVEGMLDGMLSGYDAILTAMSERTGESFSEIGTRAVDAFTQRFESEAERLREELDATIGPIAEQAGLTAGEGLISAFAQGVRDATSSGELVRAVEAALQQIRERLPSSDAKRGPLSDLTHSGRMFTRTWLGGATGERGRLAKGMNRLLAGLTPNAAFRAATAPALAGAGGPVMVNVDGRNQAAPGGLAVNARQLVSSVERELAMRGLKRGS